MNFYECAVLKLSCKELNLDRDAHVLLAVIWTQKQFRDELNNDFFKIPLESLFLVVWPT